MFRCLSLPVMLRAVLNKAAIECSRQPVTQPSSSKPPTPPMTTAGPQRMPSTSSVVTVSHSAHQSLPTNTTPPKSAVPSERGQHNPMLTSLLESAAVTPIGSTELFDSLRQKRTSLSDAMKRQASVDEVFNVGAAPTRPPAPFRVNATPPISRSYSVPTPISSPNQPVKLEPGTSLSFSNTKPPMSTPVDHGRTFSTPRSSTSELINLLSSDDFASPGGGASDANFDNQFDFNGSLKSPPGVSVAASGRTSSLTVDWSNSSSVDVSVDFDTSSNASDDRPKSVSSKNSQIMRNSLPSGGIKTEPTTVHDGATAGLVAVQNKPPITVKFSRRILKPSPQRRSIPDSESTVDRTAGKERVKSTQAPRLNSTTSDLVPPESLDFEVNSLTSVVSCVASSSPSRSSASPRLPGGAAGLPEIAKTGEKRPRVVGNKLIGTPAEKKRRSDEGRKSRKIYEFDDDNDVFVSGGSHSGKISTIKITKSEGRLQIQKSGAAGGPGSRPIHKSISSVSGQASGSSVRLSRPPGFPLRPVARSKSVMTPKSDSKALGLPAARTKPSPTVISSGGIMPASSSVVKPTVANAAKSSTNSTSAVTKSKSVQSTVKRKGSLSAVIEKLSKGVAAGAEPDKKVLYDDIRLAIIREGNKPSTPTREMSSSASSSLSKSGISSAKRPDTVKESSVRLAAPVRKHPISAGSQAADVGRGQAAMVRFTAPPASPPAAGNEQRPPHSQQYDGLVVPKIPREQQAVAADRQLPGTLQSLRPSVAVSRISEVEANQSVIRGTSAQPVVRMIRPPVSCTVLPAKSSPVNSETTGRTKTPDAHIGRGVDLMSMQSVETSDEISDRFHPARHFMDAMAHSSRVCDSNVVVDRRLSPPRSPSPPPVTIHSGTLDLTKPTVIDTSDNSRASSELMSSVIGSVSSSLESNLPVDLSADSSIGSRQPDVSSGYFCAPSDVSLRSNSTRSPSGGTCSPVASLIIDCFPGSPVILSSSNVVSSPVATSVSDTATSLPSDTDDSSRADMCRRQSMSPVTSIGEMAGTDIDDDLMNEALIMSADVSNDQLGKL